MAYLKTTWIDDVTKISAANFNHMEQGIDDAQNDGAFLNFTGNWATTTPPTNTSGTLFTLTTGGTYLLGGMATGYVGASGLMVIEAYLDGALLFNMDAYVNPVSTHTPTAMKFATKVLAAGNHYVWYRNGSNAISDTGDRGSFFAVRIG